MRIDECNNLDIFKKLKSEDPNLYKYVINYCEKIIEKLDTIKDIFEEYTDHGWSHSKKLLQLGDQLLGDNKLSSWEIAVFILAVCYHDVGMYCSSEELNEIINSKEFENVYPYLRENIISMNQLNSKDEQVLERFIQLEFLRRKHNTRSYKWILDKYKKDKEEYYFDGIYLWEAVALAAFGHTLNIEELAKRPYSTEFSIGKGITIDLVFITCLLRLTDISHLSRDRALPYIRKSKDFYSQKSLNIWKSYADIADTIPSKNGDCIKVSASCSDYRNHRAIIEAATYIEEELKREHHILFKTNSEYKFSWKFVDTSHVIEAHDANYIYSGSRFKLNFNKITELLIGSRLYRNKLFALRECLQNSIDALNVCKLKNPYLDGYIVIKYCKENNFLEIFDNGTGMDKEICSNHLLSIGTESFWVSERRHNDWGAKNNLSIIASHGIGFLSTFMIADKIDVFSKYPDKDPIHMVIDSFNTSVVFKKTSQDQFPMWKEVNLEKPLPWNQGHGTCIRLYLRESISKLELMEFISEHILRISNELILIYNNEKIIIPEKWHFGNNSYQLKSDSSFDEIKVALFDKPKEGFYNNPPKDNSLQKSLFEYNGLKGKVYLKSENGFDQTRISQNGILINNGYEFILESPLLEYSFSKKKSYRSSPFVFDIDVTGNNCFELDAERTRIIDEERNKAIREKVIKNLLKEYFNCISSIESTLYFPCGNKYYHGADSIYNNNENLVICFHKYLDEFLTPEKFQRIKSFCPVEKLFDGKLYIYFENRNVPVSVNDLKDDIETYVFYIPKKFKFNDGFKNEISQFSNWINHKQSKELVKISNSNKVVILPNFPNSFVLPLLLQFNFEIVKDDYLHYLIKFNQKENIEINLEEMNNFKTLGKNKEISDDIFEIYKEESELSEENFNNLKTNFDDEFWGL
ncbi:hypothetical protein U472_09720 [Orenia metallireducens]|uniref:HD-CE domain-containing protein n=1 Tax=Orenia metallireducens TaxID=1413210 RepID=A0A1C0A7P6_9FIRM|nr:ATP-binding protein [Orenia metallireducens]OCL26279.1 hypothetical protein U472_09720 [Orenia metallireducens]